MTSCSGCNTTDWTCLSCGKLTPVASWSDSFKTEVAVYCDCCEHQYVCKTCYAKRPGFDIWVPRFGEGHSVKDVVSGDSHLKRMLDALGLQINAGTLPRSTNTQGGAVFMFDGAGFVEYKGPKR